MMLSDICLTVYGIHLQYQTTYSEYAECDAINNILLIMSKNCTNFSKL